MGMWEDDEHLTSMLDDIRCAEAWLIVGVMFLVILVSAWIGS